MIRPMQVATLSVVGVILIGTGAWLAAHKGSDSASEPKAQVLPLAQADLNSVTQVRIFRGDGSHTTLRREATRWMVDERSYPADSGQVRKLLLDLAALSVEEKKTQDPSLYAKIGVENPSGVQSSSTGVELEVKGRHVSLIVGKTSGTSSVYVRVAGDAQSLLANPQLTPDADPRHWLDRTLLDISPDQVTAVDVAPQEGPAYALKRDSSGNFILNTLPHGRELSDPAAPDAQAASLAGLQLDDVRKAGAPGTARATYHTKDGAILTLTGRKEGELRYITVTAASDATPAPAQVQDLNGRLAGWDFELPAYRYDTLFRPLEQLLKPKPGPAAASAPGGKSVTGTLPFGPKPATDPKATPQQSH